MSLSSHTFVKHSVGQLFRFRGKFSVAYMKKLVMPSFNIIYVVYIKVNSTKTIQNLGNVYLIPSTPIIAKTMWNNELFLSSSLCPRICKSLSILALAHVIILVGIVCHPACAFSPYS